MLWAQSTTEALSPVNHRGFEPSQPQRLWAQSTTEDYIRAAGPQSRTEKKTLEKKTRVFFSSLLLALSPDPLLNSVVRPDQLLRALSGGDLWNRVWCISFCLVVRLSLMVSGSGPVHTAGNAGPPELLLFLLLFIHFYLLQHDEWRWGKELTMLRDGSCWSVDYLTGPQATLTVVIIPVLTSSRNCGTCGVDQIITATPSSKRCIREVHESLKRDSIWTIALRFPGVKPARAAKPRERESDWNRINDLSIGIPKR